MTTLPDVVHERTVNVFLFLTKRGYVMDENKKSFWKTCMFGYIPAGYFAVMLVLVIVAHIFGVNPA